jgi:hypothetical protein
LGEIMDDGIKKTYMELYQENLDLKKEIELLKGRVLSIDSVKGESGLDIHKEGDMWIILEHRKVDREGTVEPIITKVANRNVVVLWKIVKHFCPTIGDKTKYKLLVPTILKIHKLEMDQEAFNGGVNRKLYFQYYQYPAKILHKLGYVNYTLKGHFARLR